MAEKTSEVAGMTDREMDRHFRRKMTLELSENERLLIAVNREYRDALHDDIAKGQAAAEALKQRFVAHKRLEAARIAHIRVMSGDPVDADQSAPWWAAPAPPKKALSLTCEEVRNGLRYLLPFEETEIEALEWVLLAVWRLQTQAPWFPPPPQKAGA